MLKARRLSFIGHVARFGQGDRDLHLVKRVLLWRCVSWWRLQHDFNETLDVEALRFRHNGAFGRPKRYEAQFSLDYLNTLKGKV